MEPTSTDVFAIFMRYIPTAEPDKKLVKYWANAIAKGDKDTDDLLGYIAKHTEYINHIKYAFTDMFYDHLSTIDQDADVDIGKLFDRMVASQGADRPLTVEDVWRWLSNTDMFERQYSQIITKLYGRVPTETESRGMLARLRASRSYTVEMLQRDIERTSRDSSSQSAILHGGLGDVAEEMGVVGEGGAAAALLALGCGEEGTKNAVNGANGSTVNCNQPGAAASPALQCYEDMEIVDAYEAIFGRNMNVREYILYIDELRNANRSSDPSALDEYVIKLHEAHSSIFDSVKEIMHSYVERYITEDEFIGHYLARAHNPDFLSALKREVFESKEYMEKMSERLKTIYFNLYGEKMTDDDAVFLFQHAKQSEMELMSQALNETVAAFKSENDEVLQRIFDIFFDVFDREPDGVEQEKYVKFNRDRKSAKADEEADSALPQDIDDAIVLDLKQSLEYHDVLKKKITKTYAKLSKDAMFPSKVYQILDKVVPIKHYKDVDSHIEAAVRELLIGGAS